VIIFNSIGVALMTQTLKFEAKLISITKSFVIVSSSQIVMILSIQNMNNLTLNNSSSYERYITLNSLLNNNLLDVLGTTSFPMDAGYP